MRNKRADDKKDKPATTNPNVPDDLRSEYNFSNSRPNPYAERPKVYRGGARAGAGRKPAAQPAERHTITVYPADARFLRSLDANLSKAIRKLIARAR